MTLPSSMTTPCGGPGEVGSDAAGLARVLELLASHDPVDAQLPIAIETSRGLPVAAYGQLGVRCSRSTRSRSLHHCLTTGQLYRQDLAFGSARTIAA